MNRIKVLAMALVAVFAIGAVAASSALAIQAGPLFEVEGSRLVTGSKNVTTKNLGDFTLVPSGSLGAKPTTLCSGLSAPTVLLGGGTSDTTITFTGCEATGTGLNGQCDVLSVGATPGNIVVNAKDELVYVGKKEEAENETGQLGDLFTPAGGGNTFVTLIYLSLGSSCPTGSVETAVEGNVIGLVEPVNTTSKQGMLKFPAAAITKAWQWLSLGKVHEVKSALKVFGENAVQLGLADLELETGGSWAVLTQ